MDVQTGTAGREAEIVRLFAETFTASEGADEGQVIGALARDLIATTPPGDLHVFSAQDANGLTGSILFSRLRYEADPRTVMVMGPVAVRTDRQGEGIGQRLIARGLDGLRDLGVAVALTYGDPGYYVRAGFAPVSEGNVAAPFSLAHPEGWLGQSLTEGPIGTLAGPVACAPAFNDPAFW